MMQSDSLRSIGCFSFVAVPESYRHQSSMVEPLGMVSKWFLMILVCFEGLGRGQEEGEKAR